MINYTYSEGMVLSYNASLRRQESTPYDQSPVMIQQEFRLLHQEFRGKQKEAKVLEILRDYKYRASITANN